MCFKNERSQSNRTFVFLAFCMIFLLAMPQQVFPQESWRTAPASKEILLKQKRLQNSHSTALYRFGNSVDIDGDWAVISAVSDDNGRDSGAVHVFKRVKNNWIEKTRLIPEDNAAMDWFGKSVAISGDFIAVGASCDYPTGPGDPDGGFGSVYLYKNSGDQWKLTQKITCPDAKKKRDYFGCSIDLDGNDLVVGAYGRDEKAEDAGAAYVYKINTSGRVSLTARLFPPELDRYEEFYNWFGNEVAIGGDFVFICANDSYATPDRTRVIRNPGMVYIFKRSGETWSKFKTLKSPREQTHGFFGRSISISGNFAVIGAWGEGIKQDRDKIEDFTFSGYSYIYKFNGANWDLYETLHAHSLTRGEEFGYSVSIDNDKILIGAFGNSENGWWSGMTYYYKLSKSGKWQLANKLTAINSRRSQLYGWAVAVSGNYFLIGANGDDYKGLSAGAGFIVSIVEKKAKN